MIKDENFKILKTSNFKTIEDVSYYLLLFLPLPIIMAVIFSVPVYYSFKTKNIIYFTFIIFLYLIIEYFIYVYFTSDTHIDTNGIYNALIGLIVFTIMFYNNL